MNRQHLFDVLSNHLMEEEYMLLRTMRQIEDVLKEGDTAYALSLLDEAFAEYTSFFIHPATDTDESDA